MENIFICDYGYHDWIINNYLIRMQEPTNKMHFEESLESTALH